uniref:Uncharacterized protein n=1 Tax=Chromera velia CCMP2878 TaxID=1169474 RepID=A0A0G4HIG9_9ALVE|eukprot:Cvel_27784.t1-p1 / transcript=Cvel_27784.t1 / gene=Cvel_27784 / organism=Chromera_velia_CCMP2878 / gene_product=hypothetical protein / transcript_product=hypothetical protein / location=Cvel_scaffold3525:5167-9128(-) / protein_length=181 / sequence_SO=supercontig / SO=protein_coding / is_pseudo=false
MHPEHARHLANVSQNYKNHYNKWRSKQNERDGNKRTGGGKQKGDFKGGSQGQPVRLENKAQDVPSTPVSSQQLSLTDADMKRLATTILKIQQERQDSDEKKKTSERPKEERVRFATTTYDMETYEVMRRGDVDMVFPDSDDNIGGTGTETFFRQGGWGGAPTEGDPSDAVSSSVAEGLFWR